MVAALVQFRGYLACQAGNKRCHQVVIIVQTVGLKDFLLRHPSWLFLYDLLTIATTILNGFELIHSTK